MYQDGEQLDSATGLSWWYNLVDYEYLKDGQGQWYKMGEAKDLGVIPAELMEEEAEVKSDYHPGGGVMLWGNHGDIYRFHGC